MSSVSDRVQIPFSFSFPTAVFVAATSAGPVTDSVSIVQPVVGASVTITSRTTSNPATVWQAETGASTIATVTTDSGGNVPGWLDPGSYKIAVAAQGSFTGATLNFDAVRGDGVTNIFTAQVDTPQLSSTLQTTLGYVVPPHPVGVTNNYIGTTDPVDADGQTRWLIMDGRAISRSTYSVLFALIGTTYGPGNGSTTFNIPDWRGRLILGADHSGTGSGLSSHALNSTGGAETHVLTETEMPAHSHGGVTGFTNTDHYHAFSGETGGQSVDHTHPDVTILSFSAHNLPINASGPQWNAPGVGNTNWQTGGTSNDHAHAYSGNTTFQSQTYNTSNHQHVISSDGGGAAHSIMQPYVAAHHILKVLP
jgi:microcystin-dependent protein